MSRWKLFGPCALFALATSCAADQPPLKLFVFDCGQVVVNDVAAFSPALARGQRKDLVVTCFLVEHPRGRLLWDAGLPDPWIDEAAGVTRGQLDMRVERTLRSQLESIGVAPGEIELVAFSHLHLDHTGNANLFASSTWLVQEPELEVAFAPERDTATYAALEHSSKIVLDGDHDVFGDGSVVILAAPGHTPGHQVLLVDLPEHGPVLLSGDLYHFQENREWRGVPVFNFDREQTLRSMDRVEEILAQRQATLLIQHDREQMATVPRAPAYLR